MAEYFAGLHEESADGEKTNRGQVEARGGQRNDFRSDHVAHSHEQQERAQDDVHHQHQRKIHRRDEEFVERKAELDVQHRDQVVEEARAHHIESQRIEGLHQVAAGEPHTVVYGSRDGENEVLRIGPGDPRLRQQ